MTEIIPTSINSDEFSPFGQIVVLQEEEPLAESSEFSYWSDVANYSIEGETEIGFCSVYPHRNNRVTWMERHERTPELLVPIDGQLILPVMTDDDEDVQAFQFGPGEAVVIGRNKWHSACLPVGADCIRYFVIFRRGTPHEDVIKVDIPEARVRLQS